MIGLGSDKKQQVEHILNKSPIQQVLKCVDIYSSSQRLKLLLIFPMISLGFGLMPSKPITIIFASSCSPTSFSRDVFHIIIKLRNFLSGCVIRGIFLFRSGLRFLFRALEGKGPNFLVPLLPI